MFIVSVNILIDYHHYARHL